MGPLWVNRGWGWRAPDVRLFLWMRAGHGPRRVRLAVAIARWSWVPLLMVVAAMASRWGHGWVAALQCLCVAGLLQWMGKRGAQRWPTARPFALGLAPNHLGHSPRASFPSAHAMVMGTVAGFVAALAPHDPLWGAAALIAFLTAWARVHAGAHFPSDVLAGLGLGGVGGAAAAWPFVH